MGDMAFRAIEARTFLDIDKPKEVLQYLNNKKPKLPLRFIAELFMERNDKDNALATILKMTDPDEQVPLLIELQKWDECIQVIFDSKEY
jgi:hypothetical protein